MTVIPSITRYVVWVADHVAYGPVEPATITDWIRDNRITVDSWLYLEAADCWQREDNKRLRDPVAFARATQR